MKVPNARPRGHNRSTLTLAPLLLAVALLATGPAGAETAAEIEARMAVTEAQIEQRGAEMELIAEEIEAHAMQAQARDHEIELQLEEAQREL
jgi:hypothetical protein